MLRPQYPLVTERLLLRPFRPEDEAAVHDILMRADVVRYLYHGPRSILEVRAVLARWMQAVAIDDDSDAIRLAVVLRDGDVLVGAASLTRVSREHSQGQIGVLLHPGHSGLGLATETSARLFQLGFDDLGLHRIEGRTDARNLASVRMMERLGMRREAHLREAEFIKGEWTDELAYAILASEWASLRR